MYGFHKINRTPRDQRPQPDAQRWEFSHPKFLRGRTDLFEGIKRKSIEPDPNQRCVELSTEVPVRVRRMSQEVTIRTRARELVGVVTYEPSVSPLTIRFAPLLQMHQRPARLKLPDSHPMKPTGNTPAPARYSSASSSPTVFTPSPNLGHHDHDEGGPAGGDDDLADHHYVKDDPVKQDPVHEHPIWYGSLNACAYGDERGLSFDDLENIPSTSLPMDDGTCLVTINTLKPRADLYMSRLPCELRRGVGLQYGRGHLLARGLLARLHTAGRTTLRWAPTECPCSAFNHRYEGVVDGLPNSHLTPYVKHDSHRNSGPFISRRSVASDDPPINATVPRVRPPLC